MNEQRFIAPNRKAQLALAVIILCAVAIIGITEWMLANTQPHDGASLEELVRVNERLQNGYFVLVGIYAVIATFVSIYIGRIGFRALSSREFPPPGTLVVFRTKIIHGRPAQTSALLSILFAVMVWTPFLLILL